VLPANGFNGFYDRATFAGFRLSEPTADALNRLCPFHLVGQLLKRGSREHYYLRFPVHRENCPLVIKELASLAE
jgi:hypothetical protein